MPSWLMEPAPTIAVGLFLCAGLVGTLRIADRREQEHERERRLRQFGTPLPR